MAQVLTVLTFKSVDHIVADGGTQSWVLNRKRAIDCRFVVCARHRFGPWKPEGPEEHKHAFLVGRIAGIVPSSETPGRWRVEFDEYALVNGPKLPLESASPTQYFPSLDSLDIDEGALEWRALSSRAEPAPNAAAPPQNTLAEAKAMVARAFNVPVSAIEITIRA